METKKTALVVVLGDIGRSPRMQYHAVSLANDGFLVDLIGYPGSEPLPSITENENIKIHHLTPLPDLPLPVLFKYILKTVWQALSLFLVMLSKIGASFVLCQNPPGVPTLIVCLVYCLTLRAKFIIDWHNYTYSILALNTGPKHPLVKISKWIEMKVGVMADANICVTQAMKQDLIRNYKIRATVLYDRPPEIFRPITIKEKHELLLRLAKKYPIFGNGGRENLNLLDTRTKEKQKTAFTEWKGDEIVPRDIRPGLLFSSTSWTPDEDFQILLDALEEYELSYKKSKDLPSLICVITGKGPLKEHYQSIIDSKNWQNIKFVTPWLEPEDYPLMVGSADLGICLHTSSSGLDLPMKVVDMFGVGLPVLAYDYPCLSELVKNEVNSYTFGDAQELSTHLIKWFTLFPHNKYQNEIRTNLQRELSAYQNNRWQANWEKNVRKIFQHSTSK